MRSNPLISRVLPGVRAMLGGNARDFATVSAENKVTGYRPRGRQGQKHAATAPMRATAAW